LPNTAKKAITLPAAECKKLFDGAMPVRGWGPRPAWCRGIQQTKTKRTDQ
jgi:hypothetical protein